MNLRVRSVIFADDTTLFIIIRNSDVPQANNYNIRSKLSCELIYFQRTTILS